MYHKLYWPTPEVDPRFQKDGGFPENFRMQYCCAGMLLGSKSELANYEGFQCKTSLDPSMHTQV